VRLSRLFLLSTLLLLGLVSAMLVRSVLADLPSLTAAREGLAALERAYLAMQVAEKASAERGPSNAVLGDTEPADPAKRARMAEFRRSTDAAFATALSALEGQRDPGSLAGRAQLQQAQQQIAAARTQIDRVAALPLAERVDPGQRFARRAIEQMFGVIDTVLGGITALSAEAEATYPELALPLVGARYAAELREYAGRLGSQFNTPVSAQAPLGAVERREIPELIGRIQQLRQLITVQARVSRADASLQAAIDKMESSYFRVGMGFIESMTTLGLAGQPYGLDSAGFVARYVPPMKSIVELRDTLHTAAREAAQARVARTERRVGINLVLGVTILAIEVSVFLIIRRRVLVPLLRSTRRMAALMRGEMPPAPGPSSTRRDELGDLERAVAALRDATLRSRALEAERERLIEQLRDASNTDFLTGLPNRRAFVERATSLLAHAPRHDWSVALLLFDLDHFKRINDSGGHPFGDLVLQQTAALAINQVRKGELLARHGGEEFVIFAVDCVADEALLLAERLRRAIEQAPLPGGGREGLSVTASFGLASAPARSLRDLEGLFRDADRLLYVAKAQGRNRVVHAGNEPSVFDPSR
jgi:diguanylate cyclase (GGDEF)-like protein